MNNPVDAHNSGVPLPQPPEKTVGTRKLCIRLFGVGTTGIKVMEQLTPDLTGVSFVGVCVDPAPTDGNTVPGYDMIHLETPLLRGLGTGGDPDRGRGLAEEHYGRLRDAAAGADVVFLVAGLGGGAGTGITPVLARAAKEAGALVLAFVTTPFECEGNRRVHLAREGVQHLKAAADGVICLPNQNLFKLIDENTTVVETFKKANALLADGVRGLWRLLIHSGILEIHFSDICQVVRDRHSESAFAVAEAAGANRSQEVAEKVLAHPMLDGGQALLEADAVLISILGGPDLTMTQVNRLAQELGQNCERAQVVLGAAIDPLYQDRLSVTLIASRKADEDESHSTRVDPEELASQVAVPPVTTRHSNRCLPPAPHLSEDQIRKVAARQGDLGHRHRKGFLRMRQTQLPLEIVNKGRFEKSEPTVHKGEDLDIPTFVRRGIRLN